MFKSEKHDTSDNEFDVGLLRRLSRSMDSNGKYRMKTRASPQFARSIAFLALIFCIIIGVSINPEWFIQHFIEFEAESVEYIPYQIAAGIMLSVYLYDLIIMDGYSSLDYPLIIHHILTIIAAMLIIIGRYSPFSTWYGICMVAMAFPYKLAQAFRYEYCWRYPEFTRTCFKYLHVYWLILMICNLVGQFYMIVYGGIVLMEVPVYDVILYSIACVFWIYADSMVLKALKSWSVQNYENINWNLAFVQDVEMQDTTQLSR